MYKLINLVSIIIRIYILPSPYTNLFNSKLNAEVFNILIGGSILHFLSFILGECVYYKWIDNPAKGSLGYLIGYCYLTTIKTMFGYYISSVK